MYKINGFQLENFGFHFKQLKHLAPQNTMLNFKRMNFKQKIISSSN